MTARPARFHRVDVLVTAIVAIGIAAGAVGYRALRRSQPKVDALEPATIRAASPVRVRLHGRDLRPFLQVFLVKAGVPLVLRDASSGYQSATYFLIGGREAEVEVPALASGVYDLYLYDQGQRMSTLSAALRVQSETHQPVTMTATVRFFVPNEMASMIRVGDQDGASLPRQDMGRVAELREMTLRQRPAETVDFDEADRQVFAGFKTLSRVVDAKLAVPVTRGDDGMWTYKGSPVRAGEDFTFETDRYVMSGITLDVDMPR
jgi:hypothetical protein